MADLAIRAFVLAVSVLSAAASHRFTPTDNYLLVCGASSTTVDDGRVFVPDAPFLASPSLESHVALANPDSPSALYRAARVFRGPSSYKFEIKQKGIHLVRLHFYSLPSKDQLASARFHVVADGSVLMRDCSMGDMMKGSTGDTMKGSMGDMMKGPGSLSRPLVKEFILTLDSEELQITFIPVVETAFAFVNVIEVVSAPADLLPNQAKMVAPDHVEDVKGVSAHGFETLFRLNVGGAKVTPFNDTLWRTWVPDGDFFTKLGAADVKPVYFSGRIQYQEYGASREIAPDNVYDTARVISYGENSNMSWEFDVTHCHKYLIRMHFCDIASMALNELYFDVYINGYLAYENVDLSEATGRTLAAPYYIDFMTEPDSMGHLTVTIVPSKLSSQSKIGGLLNGLEIMKMSNSAGNLDGELSATWILNSSTGMGLFGSIIRMVSCGFAFSALVVAGFMLVSRWKNATRSSAGWSRLPIDVADGRPSHTTGKSINF